MGSDLNETWPAGLLAGCLNGSTYSPYIITVLQHLDMPAIGFEPFSDVLPEGDIGIALDADVIVVIEIDDITQTEMTGKGSRFGRHAFHHISVAADGVDRVVEDIVTGFIETCRETLLRDGHADAVCESLAQWSRGDLDPGCEAIFRMTGGEDKAVAVGPGWVFRIIAHVFCPKDESHRRGGHGCSGMTRVGFLNRIGREYSHGIDTQCLDVCCSCGGHKN